MRRLNAYSPSCYLSTRTPPHVTFFTSHTRLYICDQMLMLILLYYHRHDLMLIT